MVQEFELIEVDIDGRTFWVRPVGSWVLESGNVVAEGLAAALAVLTLGRRVLLRQHRTQPGALDGYIGNIGVRRLA